jgi:hypothetical protein
LSEKGQYIRTGVSDLFERYFDGTFDNNVLGYLDLENLNHAYKGLSSIGVIKHAIYINGKVI